MALCGGSQAGEFVWMADGVDYATTWVGVRPMWGWSQEGALAALQDVEASLPFALLGLESGNGGRVPKPSCTQVAPKAPAAGFHDGQPALQERRQCTCGTDECSGQRTLTHS